MGWKNAPLASDEIYEAKIATTNLPPRHHTTLGVFFIFPIFVCFFIFCLGLGYTQIYVWHNWGWYLYVKPSQKRVQYANHPSEIIKHQTFITFLAFVNFPRIYRSIGCFAKAMKAAGAPIWAVSWLHPLQPSQQNARLKLTWTLTMMVWKKIVLRVMGSFDVQICFCEDYLKLYIRHRSIYKAQTTRSVRDCFYPMSPLEKKGWVGNWKMNFHLERSLTEV